MLYSRKLQSLCIVKNIIEEHHLMKRQRLIRIYKCNGVSTVVNCLIHARFISLSNKFLLAILASLVS